MALKEELVRTAKKNSWKKVLFDMDDVLIPFTDKLWDPGHRIMAVGLANLVGITVEEAITIFGEMNNQKYYQMGVHPRKYEVVIKELARKYNFNEELLRPMKQEAMRTIYLGTPDLSPEVREILEAFEMADASLGVVSHSSPGRINNIVRTWGYQGRMGIFSESMHKKKGEEVWERAKEGVSAEQIVAVDDNLGSLLAARHTGIKTVVWVKPKWEVFLEGDSKGLVTIDNIGQLAGALIYHFG